VWQQHSQQLQALRMVQAHSAADLGGSVGCGSDIYIQQTLLGCSCADRCCVGCCMA
jgi:hypothetical protein